MNSKTEDDEPTFRPPAGGLVLGAFVVVMAAAICLPRTALPGSNIRVRNNTESPMYQVVINGQLYGNIDAGKASEYRNMRVAYRYASALFITRSHEMHLMPDDYVGEVPLGSGRFTYVLNIVEADQVRIDVEKDSL